jgi:hypothetical protein
MIAVPYANRTPLELHLGGVGAHAKARFVDATYAGAPLSPYHIAHSARLCLLFHKPDRPIQCRTGIWADTSCGLRREIILWPDMSLGVLRQPRRKERQRTPAFLPQESTPAFLPQARVKRHAEGPLA